MTLQTFGKELFSVLREWLFQLCHLYFVSLWFFLNFYAFVIFLVCLYLASHEGMLLACMLLIYGVICKYFCFRLLMSEPKQESKEGRERERDFGLVSVGLVCLVFLPHFCLR